MTVYYRGPLATITHETISVPSVGCLTVAIDDVGAVRAIEVGSGHLVARHRVLGVTASVVALLAVPVVGPVSVLLTVVILVVLSGYLVACHRIRPTLRYQLIALVGGEWTTLVETGDAVAFRQVGRGLQRALEHREDLGRMSRREKGAHRGLGE